MPKRVVNRFRILLAHKEVRDGRAYSYQDIAEATGLNPRTIAAYSTNRAQRFDASTLMVLCDWLDCEIGDLLMYPPAMGQQGAIARAMAAA